VSARGIGLAARLAVAAMVLASVPAAAGTAAAAPARGAAPPRFPMAMDSGPRLLAQKAQAEADLAAISGILPGRREQVERLRDHWNALEARLSEMDLLSRRAADRLADARDRVQRAAADAYKLGAAGALGSTVRALSNAHDVLDLSRDLKLLGQYSTRHHQAIDEYESLKQAADDEVALLTEERANVRARYEDGRRELGDAEARVSGAQRRYDEAVSGLRRFHEVAVDSGSPIRGPSFLTADELVAFVASRGHHPRLTVSLRELAQLYVDEGRAEIVRGDVAFAQSILETGWFEFPDGGLVHWTDNNFAGIGACDSCEHGFRFETAQLGVRAQIQALRIYVDRTVGPATLAHPPVLSNRMFRLGFRGDVQSWWDLTGTWATGANYGNHLYNLYLQMVEFALARRGGAPPRA
jgi:hypothetical protein